MRRLAVRMTPAFIAKDIRLQLGKRQGIYFVNRRAPAEKMPWKGSKG